MIAVQQHHYGRVNQRLTSRREMDALPIGAEFGDANYNYKKIGDSLWVRVGNEAGQRYSTHQFDGGQYRVKVLPEGFEQCDPPQETIEGYMFRFQDEALYMATTHGVSYTASVDAIRAMGADKVPIGYGVQVKNQHYVNSLPEGTVIWRGDPSTPHLFGVYVRTASSWRQVLGGSATGEGTTTIHSVNGSSEPPSWLTREGTEADAEAIRQFRAKAWRLGWELKRSQGWCSTYESVMRQLGLTQSALREARTDVANVGQRYSAEEARGLPVGTVLQWRSTTSDEWAYYLRHASMEAENVAGTRLICGQVSSQRNYRSSMQVVALHPDEGSTSGVAVLPFVDQNFIASLPVGTLFHTAEAPRPQYVIARDRTVAQWSLGAAIPEHGTWVSTQFGTYENLYYHGWDGATR